MKCAARMHTKNINKKSGRTSKMPELAAIATRNKVRKRRLFQQKRSWYIVTGYPVGYIVHCMLLCVVSSMCVYMT